MPDPGARVNQHVSGSGNLVTGTGDIYVGVTPDQVAAGRARALFTIPAPVADFTGRAADIDALVADLTSNTPAALISSLHGMGGVGKTQLALVVAQRLATSYPDAALYVQLQPGDQPLPPATILGNVIHAFDAAARLPESVDELKALCRQTLHGKRGLLLLDNALDAAQVTPLLPPPAGWAVLVTSRRRFVLSGSAPHDLDVLRSGDALTLLKVLLKKHNRPEISRLPKAALQPLLDLCGRLPLAIRLAASYLGQHKNRSLPEYLADLRAQPFRNLLVDGQPPLEKTLGLSVDRLTGDPQAAELARLWRLLAVFPAPFDLAATSAALGLTGDQSRDTLTALLDHSLVDYDGKSSTYSLHDLLRQYAVLTLPLADAPALTAARNRHAANYLARGSAANDVYQQGGDHVLDALRAFDALSSHLDAAWDWMHAQETPAALAFLSSYPGSMPHLLDLRLNPRQLIPLLETALAAARRLNDRQAEGVHLGNLGLTYDALGDYPKAIDRFQQALAIQREISDRQGEGTILGNLGNAYNALGAYHKAIDHHTQVLAISRDIVDRHMEGNSLGNLAVAYRRLGDYPKAIDHHRHALAIHREIGDRRAEGADLGNLGLAYAGLGDYPKAIDYHTQALAICREIGDRRGEGNHLSNLGNVYHTLGDYPKAIHHYQQALAIARQIGDRHGEGARIGGMANCYLSLGNYHKAIDQFQQALAIHRKIGGRQMEGAALGGLGNAHSAIGEYHKAIAHHAQALSIARQIGDRRNVGVHLGNLGLAYFSLGDYHKAIDFYQQALAIARQIGDRHLEGNALANLGLAYFALGDKQHARELWHQALRIYEEIQSPTVERVRDWLADSA